MCGALHFMHNLVIGDSIGAGDVVLQILCIGFQQKMKAGTLAALDFPVDCLSRWWAGLGGMTW